MILIDLKEVYANFAGIPVTGRDLCDQVRLAEPSAPMWKELDKPDTDTLELSMDGAKCFCIMIKKRVRQLRRRPEQYNQNTNSGFFLFLGAMIRSAEYIPLLISLYWELQGEIDGEELEEDIPPASE